MGLVLNPKARIAEHEAAIAEHEREIEEHLEEIEYQKLVLRKIHQIRGRGRDTMRI